MSEKKQKKKGNILFPVLIIICLAVMGYSLYQLVSISMEYKQGEKEYDSLQSYVTELPKDDDNGSSKDTEQKEDQLTGEAAPAAEEGETSDIQSEVCPISVNMESLRNVNPDLVCWLYIPVLEISYPVVQGTDNEQYLHHTFEGTANFAGSIFVDAEIEHPLEDPHTIIYGHSMKNQTMFGKLKLLLQDDLYQQDPVFWIITEEESIKYQMADIRYTEAGSSIYTIFQESGEEYTAYLREMMDTAVIKNGQVPELNENSRLVTLSTCAAAEGTERLVVRGIAADQ